MADVQEMTSQERQAALAEGRWRVDPPCPTCREQRLPVEYERPLLEEPIMMPAWEGGPMFDTGMTRQVPGRHTFTLSCGHTLMDRYTLTVWRAGEGPDAA